MSQKAINQKNLLYSLKSYWSEWVTIVLDAGCSFCLSLFSHFTSPYSSQDLVFSQGFQVAAVPPKTVPPPKKTLKIFASAHQKTHFPPQPRHGAVSERRANDARASADPACPMCSSGTGRFRSGTRRRRPHALGAPSPPIAETHPRATTTNLSRGIWGSVLRRCSRRERRGGRWCIDEHPVPTTSPPNQAVAGRRCAQMACQRPHKDALVRGWLARRQRRPRCAREGCLPSW